LEYFVLLAEEAEPRLRGAEQLEWLNRLDLEQENLRAALHMTLEGDNAIGSRYADRAVRLVNSLWWFWFIRGHFSEGRRWAERVLAYLEQHDPSSGSAGRVLYVTASFCFYQGDISRATDLSQKSLSICETHQDTFGQVFSYHRLGQLSIPRDAAQANKYLSQGLKIATQIENTWLITNMRMDLGRLAINTGNHGAAMQQYRQALETARQCGDKLLIMYCLANLTIPLLQQGELQQAAMLAEESLSISQMLGARRGITFALLLLGRIALREKQYLRAGELIKGSLRLIWSTRDRDSVIETLVHLIDYEAEQGNFEIAARILAACEVALKGFPAGYRLPNQSLFDQLVESLQARLEPGIFTAAWTLGRLMSLEQAVSFALVDHPSRQSQ
jgi:tetratricopeptide (TPR) repeat protein